MEKKLVRCAIYTRKSTEGAHDAKLTSCESQRDACIQWATQRKDFIILPTLYDDLGYSGGNTNRPAFQKLLVDINKGGIDAVLVYDFDRLSRSVKDFPVITSVLRERGVKTYSVTENYDGMAQHYGDLMLNLKVSIAEFQRMDAAARVTQKLTFMAEQGLRVGGSPIIGYDIVDKAWVPNESEKRQALDQFEIYLKTHSLMSTARALNGKGYRTKKWLTPKKVWRGGQPYSKNTLHRLLRNPVYIGMIRYAGKLHPGKHPSIIPREIYDAVQALLTANGEGHDSLMNGSSDLWLKGKIRCAVCGSSMTPSWAYSKGKRYEYYECTKARNLGKDICPVRRVPAGPIHQVILDRITFLGAHPPLVKAFLKDIEEQTDENQMTFETEIKRVSRELTKLEYEGKNMAEAMAQGTALRGISFIEKKLQDIEERKKELSEAKARLEHQAATQSTRLPSSDELISSLKRFPESMMSLEVNARKELADLLLREVVYNEPNGNVTMTLYPLPELQELTLRTPFRKVSQSAEGRGFEPLRAVRPYTLSRRAV